MRLPFRRASCHGCGGTSIDGVWSLFWPPTSVTVGFLRTPVAKAALALLISSAGIGMQSVSSPCDTSAPQSSNKGSSCVGAAPPFRSLRVLQLALLGRVRQGREGHTESTRPLSLCIPRTAAGFYLQWLPDPLTAHLVPHPIVYFG